MTRLILHTFIAAMLCAPMLAAGQTVAPEPATAAPINADLVVVDVVVTDAQHKPVHNLTTADFVVLENGHPQTTKTFEEHHTWDAAAPLSTTPNVSPGTFTNFTSAPTNGAMNILLLDALNTPMSAQATVRQQMMNYLKQARPGMRMAIFGLASKLVLLQGFASDPGLLSTVLKEKEDVAKDSVETTDAVNGDTPAADNSATDETEDTASALGNVPGKTQLVAEMEQFDADRQSFPLQLRARLTLDAFNLLGRYLSRLPGRKNLIWFSGSFPINILPDGNLENPFGAVASSEDEFRETTGLMSRSQVAVYPIDAHVPVAAPAQSSSGSRPQYVRKPASSVSDNSSAAQQNAEGPGTMQAMADATGGEVYASTNGLKEAVEKAVQAGSNYYTLTYAPTGQQGKGDFRKIQVMAARPGLTLAYRRGYFADDPKAPPRSVATEEAGTDRTAYSAMRSAMVQGGPEPTEIIFSATIRPANADPEPDVAPGNEIVGSTQGPYRRYTVQFGMDARDVECTPAAEGAHHCVLESVIFVYDADGVLLNSVAGGMSTDFPADKFAALQQSGFHFHEDISVPVDGASFLRIGVIDETTNKVGTVELPISAVSKLPPLAVAGPK
ncbi:MAG TPA: VWA domain-containing protein [Terracidiphilus sp.]|nr:VWA domain-containing protein [Terracidiphilus sp.]